MKPSQHNTRKASRKQYAIHLMGQPYGLVTAVSSTQAVSFFHKLTGQRYFNVFGYDVVATKIG